MRDVVAASFHPFDLYMYSVAGYVGDDVKFIDPLHPVYWTNNIVVFVKNILLIDLILCGVVFEVIWRSLMDVSKNSIYIYFNSSYDICYQCYQHDV